MESRLLPMAVAALGVVAVPGPRSVVALGWLGPAPSFALLLVLAAVAFVVLTGGALLVWKLLTRHWPPREAVGVLVVVVTARLILDVVRMMGLWIL